VCCARTHAHVRGGDDGQFKLTWSNSPLSALRMAGAVRLSGARSSAGSDATSTSGSWHGSVRDCMADCWQRQVWQLCVCLTLHLSVCLPLSVHTALRLVQCSLPTARSHSCSSDGVAAASQSATLPRREMCLPSADTVHHACELELPPTHHTPARVCAKCRAKQHVGVLGFISCPVD
jgi:hypothetical protein